MDARPAKRLVDRPTAEMVLVDPVFVGELSLDHIGGGQFQRAAKAGCEADLRAMCNGPQTHRWRPTASSWQLGTSRRASMMLVIPSVQWFIARGISLLEVGQTGWTAKSQLSRTEIGSNVTSGYDAKIGSMIGSGGKVRFIRSTLQAHSMPSSGIIRITCAKIAG